MQDKKSDRVEQLLKETEAYLEKLGVKLREQKDSTKGKNKDSVVEMQSAAEVVVGRDQTQVGSIPIVRLFGLVCNFCVSTSTNAG